MAPKHRTAFFAYPGQPIDLTQTIQSGSEAVNRSSCGLIVKTWPQMDVFGANIPDEVRQNIQSADLVFADITQPNLNVYYEAGYAIGQGKPLAPVINSAFAGAITEIQRDGLFDNIGYRTYENSEQLRTALLNKPETNLIELYSKPINFQQPLFLLDTYRKTDFRNAITSAIKSSKVFYRSFDPVETPRLSTVQLVTDVTSSSGIIIPFLAPHIEDAARHNLRAAFLAGLGHGLERYTLLLQLQRADHIGPTDYRDMIQQVRDDKDISEIVSKFAQDSFVASTSITKHQSRSHKSALQQLSLGASAAENEFRTLEDYFVETAEFVRALRGEVNIVAGRKGAGKTAIFFRVRDTFRSEKKSIVTDLKPESHQLSLFREQLLGVVDVGGFDHTLSAFWYFVIVSEILLTIYKQAEHRSKFDMNCFNVMKEISDVLGSYQLIDSGDFTARLNRLSSYVAQEIHAVQSKKEALSPERLTNIIFRGGISKVRSLIEKHTSRQHSIVLLFDNIDKGWPASGVDKFDIRLVRLLGEALDKVKRDFSAHERDFMSIMFVRNDIYELMVQQTPDRGKAGQVRIDWTDRAKLRQVIYMRLQSSTGNRTDNFDTLWHTFFPSHVNAKESFEYFVDHCLMRPRFLINIIENAIANAINRGHTGVEEEDCTEAVRQHSYNLIDDFGYEIRDVSGVSSDLMYSFVGCSEEVKKEEALDRLKNGGLSESETEIAFQLMLWYGVLGVKSHKGEAHFIYDYEYNMKRLEAEVRNFKGEETYTINPALHVALGC